MHDDPLALIVLGVDELQVVQVALRRLDYGALPDAFPGENPSQRNNDRVNVLEIVTERLDQLAKADHATTVLRNSIALPALSKWEDV